MNYSSEEDLLIGTGEVVRFNSEITCGEPYIRYNESRGTLILTKAGRYVLNLTIYVSKILLGERAQLCLKLDDKEIVCHDLLVNPGGATFFSFTDVIHATKPNSKLYVLNKGLDFLIPRGAGTAAGISIFSIF